MLPLKDTKKDGDALYSQKVAFEAYFAKQQRKHFLHISGSHDMVWYVWVEESEIFLIIKNEGKKEKESGDSLMTASGVVELCSGNKPFLHHKTIASVLCKSGMEIRLLSSILDVSRNKWH